MSAAAKTTILAVEDDPELLQMIKTMLSAVGEVTTASDGQAAYELLQAGFLPDVIVTDVMMPRMDGLTLAKQLKNDPTTASIPVVMLTAKGSPRDVIGGINAGARHYVSKPFKAAELLDKVQKSVRR